MQVDSITLPLQFDPQSYNPTFDGTGVAAGNLVTGEVQVFEPNTDSPYTFIMPSWGPFFATGVVVEKLNGSSVYEAMDLGSEYHLCFPFVGASRALNKPVFAGILFHTLSAEATIRLRYQTLGGEWVTGQEQNEAIMAQEERHPGTVALEQVAAFDEVFPIVTTAWDKQDPTTMDQVQSKMTAIADRIRARVASLNYTAPLAHLGQLNNPHETDKVDLNLGLVANYGPASAISARNPTNNTEYVNTLQANSMMRDWVYSASATRQGVSKINLGTNPGDDLNETDALTAAGFSNITADAGSAINQAYNKGQLSRSVTPFPFTYPIEWNGVQYNTKAAFVRAVEIYTGISPLEYNEDNGKFWFPANTSLPVLTIVQL